jgi:mono/diheme cytochrome c family protein
MIKWWLAAIAMLCCASSLLYAQADPKQAPGIISTRSVWSGVYSEAQASRGEYAYWDDECGRCHGDTLYGDSGLPDLAGSHFMLNWDGQSALDLIRHIHAMPNGDPGDIGMAEATDLVAFILRENGFPAGSSDLPADRRVLAGIRIDALKPDTK